MKQLTGITFIAEVKTESPFGWQSEKSWDKLFAVAKLHGDMLSIHTDPRWGGSFELLKKARSLTEKPLLAKGIHASDSEIEQALDIGATAVLVVGRLPRADLLQHCYIEPLNLAQLVEFNPSVEHMIWNSRNLEDGKSKEETWERARKIRSSWLCQASNVAHLSDVKSDAQAVLVGTHLESFVSELNS